MKTDLILLIDNLDHSSPFDSAPAKWALAEIERLNALLDTIHRASAQENRAASE